MTTDRTEPATTPSAITLREVAVDGARLRYAEAGTGDPLVLLHGWPESHLAWEHQLEPLSRLRRVIAPDWFGWGESTRAPGWNCDYDSEVDRIARMLDALGLDRVDFACHDYGGFLGLGFVQRHPDRVRRFAILNSRAQGTFTPAFYLLFGLFTVAARHRLLRPLLTTAPIYWVHRIGMAGYLRNGTFDSERLGRYLAMLRTPRGRREYARFWAGYDVRERPELAIRLAEISCPTTVIWGTREPAIPMATAEQLARDIEGAELIRIDADHFLMEQRPAEVTDALRGWLQRPAY
ncbi:alpha/beta hydrolase [Nocardia cyriacigeorgica]|uniref:alpha/beta fold hydrolase n=1 Tax=Nocardia cyriacigeorgica TaxID=135487 RepID=UPI001895FCE4|nr:alpha/beta hydrolase [Nocardia cyriacigeorgica]MBF6092812.1 alpha/beta hydrolase [Nocardia cyriacigeorgica]MBF6099727.1 alpha/beta hydrolase [Nocardia cyriacigeorgica]MBF6319481.1 alpha/beta hydrolase [Nocardia cyriacigeorgica]MBF6343561.1 alpha/beta hydrolase [Nocardia cyriacigeorgica]MBF6516246.1 alpha/beta hydrolase [Nocardia cyriacigeorgica]